MRKVTYRCFILLFLFFGFTLVLSAQQISRLHIVTEKTNKLPGLAKFHFTINGQPYILKAGECLEKTVQTSKIDIVLEDKRWVKQNAEDLHVPAEADLYVWVYLKNRGGSKEPFYAAEIICKSCFDERKSRCKKTITE